MIEERNNLYILIEKHAEMNTRLEEQLTLYNENTDDKQVQLLKIKLQTKDAKLKELQDKMSKEHSQM